MVVHNEIRGSHNANYTDDNGPPILSVSSTILKPITEKTINYIRSLATGDNDDIEKSLKDMSGSEPK